MTFGSVVQNCNVRMARFWCIVEVHLDFQGGVCTWIMRFIRPIVPSKKVLPAASHDLLRNSNHFIPYSALFCMRPTDPHFLDTQPIPGIPKGRFYSSIVILILRLPLVEIDCGPAFYVSGSYGLVDACFCVPSVACHPDNIIRSYHARINQIVKNYTW